MATDKTLKIVSVLADEIIIASAVLGVFYWFTHREQINRTIDGIGRATDAVEKSGLSKILGIF